MEKEKKNLQSEAPVTPNEKELSTKEEYTTADEYIELFDGEVKEILRKTRETIRNAAPDAKEKISWKMPTFYMKKNLIHFAAGKNHLGIYPGPIGVEYFTERWDGYKTSKGAIQFPYSKPIPYEIIEELTRYLVGEAVKGE